MDLPPGYTAIKDINVGYGGQVNVNILGILVDIEPPKKSQGEDWYMIFSLRDDEFAAQRNLDASLLRCKLFRRNCSHFPSGKVGDPVILRQVQVQLYQGVKKEGICSARLGQVLFFPADKVPVPELSTGYGRGGHSKLPFSGSLQLNGTSAATAPSSAEQLAIIGINAKAAPYTPAVKKVSNPVAASRRQDRYALIKDVKPYNYYDLAAEVVKIYWGNNAGGSVDLYITDYTTNKDLFRYEPSDTINDFGTGTSRPWQGPFGQVTLAVKLWDLHASWAREHVREGHWVMLTNVHIKMSPANKIEGALHADQVYPDKLLISKVTRFFDEEVMQQLGARKRAYLEKYERDDTAQEPGGHATKPSAKAAAKKKAKKARERERKESEQRQLEQEVEAKAAARANINEHVVASHPEIRLTSFEEIMDDSHRTSQTPDGRNIVYPFVNMRYRTRVRVVDFHPPDLEDFSRSMKDPDWNPALRDPHGARGRRDDRWVWGFVLFVEDATSTGEAPKRMILSVDDRSGQFLLDMDAIDLRNDKGGHAMTKLEEKLFILWGNLRELKRDLSLKGVQFPLSLGDKRLQNKAFECCIEEYGAEVPPSPQWPTGWQRMHKLASTVIRG